MYTTVHILLAIECFVKVYWLRHFAEWTYFTSAFILYSNLFWLSCKVVFILQFNVCTCILYSFWKPVYINERLKRKAKNYFCYLLILCFVLTVCWFECCDICPCNNNPIFIHMPQNTIIITKLIYRPLLLPLYKYGYIFFNIHLFWLKQIHCLTIFFIFKKSLGKRIDILRAVH